MAGGNEEKWKMEFQCSPNFIKLANNIGHSCKIEVKLRQVRSWISLQSELMVRAANEWKWFQTGKNVNTIRTICHNNRYSNKRKENSDNKESNNISEMKVSRLAHNHIKGIFKIMAIKWRYFINYEKLGLNIWVLTILKAISLSKVLRLYYVETSFPVRSS